MTREGPLQSPEATGVHAGLPADVGRAAASAVDLTWKPPLDGGAVSAYRIQRRHRDGGAWADVGTSVDITTRLEGQDTGVELEYRVLGVNAAGAGPASNIVRVVL